MFYGIFSKVQNLPKIHCKNVSATMNIWTKKQIRPRNRYHTTYSLKVKRRTRNTTELHVRNVELTSAQKLTKSKPQLPAAYQPVAYTKNPWCLESEKKFHRLSQKKYIQLTSSIWGQVLKNLADLLYYQIASIASTETLYCWKLWFDLCFFLWDRHWCSIYQYEFWNKKE